MNGSVAVSTLTFRPLPDDDGTILKCEGSNPRLPNSALEDSFVLVVMCKYRRIRISREKRTRVKRIAPAYRWINRINKIATANNYNAQKHKIPKIQYLLISSGN